MSDYDHKAVPQQGGDGGYRCLLCSKETVLILGTNTWFHKDEAPAMQDFPGERRSPVKSFKPRGPQNYTSSDFIDVNTWYKNRREALFCSVSAQTLDSSDEDIFDLAERMEEWLNRPLGQYDHIRVEVEGDIHINGPDVLHVIKDEVQDLP